MKRFGLLALVLCGCGHPPVPPDSQRIQGNWVVMEATWSQQFQGDNEAILNHCRGEGPHVRGCWVIDALLGKA